MSTYSQGYATCNVNNDAEFRARGKWFSDQLTTIGWGKTADTGQIDWTTVAKPGAGSTVAGYEIRKSSDGLTDIYVKIEYGSGSTATNIGFWITAGAGSDGTGGITGSKTARMNSAGSYNSAVASTDYLSGTAGRFVLMNGCQTGDGTLANSRPGICVQRTTDTSGVDNSNGFIVTAIDSATTHEHVDFAAGSSGGRVAFGWTLNGASPIPGSAGAVPVFPIYIATASEFIIERDLVVIPTAYAALGSTHTFSLMGSNRTWIVTWGGTTTTVNEAGVLPANVSIAMRWE